MCPEFGVEGGGPPDCVRENVVKPIEIMDYSMSSDFSILFGLIQDLANQVVEGLINTIEKVDKAAEVSSDVELGMAGANIAAGGTLTKGVLAATATTTALDLTSAGLEFAKANITDQDFSTAQSKLTQAGLGPIVGKTIAAGSSRAGSKMVQQVSNTRGATHRSTLSGKFVTNFHAATVTSTGPAAVGIAAVKTLFKRE